MGRGGGRGGGGGKGALAPARGAPHASGSPLIVTLDVHPAGVLSLCSQHVAAEPDGGRGAFPGDLVDGGGLPAELGRAGGSGAHRRLARVKHRASLPSSRAFSGSWPGFFVSRGERRTNYSPYPRAPNVRPGTTTSAPTLRRGTSCSRRAASCWATITSLGTGRGSCAQSTNSRRGRAWP